jgi:hypothetical protein
LKCLYCLKPCDKRVRNVAALRDGRRIHRGCALKLTIELLELPAPVGADKSPARIGGQAWAKLAAINWPPGGSNVDRT